MDEEELLYREMNEEDPWYMGDRPNEYEDDTDEEQVALTAGAFLLFWNPAESNYTLEQYASDRDKFGRRFAMNWTIIEHELAHKDDRYYMIRLGEGNTGVVWRGTFSSEPYMDEQNQDNWYVDIIVEDAVKPDKRALITMEELHSENAEVDWTHMECGQAITRELADRFDEIIRVNWFKESHPYKGHTSKEAYEAGIRKENKSCLLELMTFLIFLTILIMIITVL